jgi:hypothetical protein
MSGYWGETYGARPGILTIITITSLVPLNRRHTGRSLLRSTPSLASAQAFNELRAGHDQHRLRDRDDDLAVFVR